MKIVISPAKSLNFEKQIPIHKCSESIFLKESKKIQQVLRKIKPKDLMELMDISQNLADLNYKRNLAWQLPFTKENAKPAAYVFDGEVYNGLQIDTLALEKVPVLQDKLRILSGLYGLLKPLDLIQAYRLEMGIKLPVGTASNLYDFWKTKITNQLNKELSQDEIFVNLASIEYFSAVDVKKLKVPVITPEFKDYKDGKLKTISFFAKKARGLMVRYIIDSNAETIDDLKQFDDENYRFDENLSKGNHLIFTR